MTDGIRAADTDCIADGIKVTDTGCMANGIGYLRRKANMNTFAGLQQVLEFDMEEASLEAQVELENLMVRWKDTKQQYHKALVQVSEHLEHIGDGLMEVRKSVNELSRQTAEIKKFDMEKQRGEEELQKLFMKRVHLKERSTVLQAEVKNMEGEIKRRFLDPKPKDENACVGTLGEKEDRTMRIGALCLEEVDMCRIGAVRQNSKRKALEPIQADFEPNCSKGLHENRYVKRTVKPKASSSKDILEEEMLKKIAEVRRKTRRRNDDESSLDLRFVSTTVHGKKFSALIDTGATHSFLSRKAASSFEIKRKASMEKEVSAFKAVNSSMKAVNGVMKDTHVRVGSWFGKIDLRVIDMDDHAMVLGRDFMVAAQAIPMVDRDILLILDDGKTMMVPMTRKSRLGYQPRMASLILYEKDPDMDHTTSVEQRGLGSMSQTTKEERMFDFVGRDLKERRKGADVASFLEHVAEKTTQDLHQDDEKKDTSSDMGPGEGYTGRDPAGIVEFCRYAMGIYDFQLTKEKLGKLGCTQEEVDAVHEYLKTRHQSDTWVDESQGGNFLALAMK